MHLMPASKPAKRSGKSIVISSRRPAVLAAVKDFAATVERSIESDETIIEVLHALPEVPRAEHMEQLRRNADMRARFLKGVPLLKSADVARLSGSSARNVSAKANRWKSEKRVFSVVQGGVDHFPAFQFTDDGQPAPAIAEILGIFSGLSDWQIALWFFAPNGWLAEEPPMDVVQREPQAVIAAARRAVEPLEV